MTLEQIAEAVMQHAEKHYNENGWDYIVECFSIGDIVRELTECNVSTLPEAIKEMGEYAGLLDERRTDIQSTIF